MFLQTVGLTRKFVFCKYEFYFSLPILFRSTLPSVTCLSTKSDFRAVWNNKWGLNWKSRRNLRRQYVEVVCEMHDLFTYRYHSGSARIFAPRKLQCPESYRVQDNGRTITVQLHFSWPQELRGSIQEHRLQLNFQADMRMKRHSLYYPNYFLL